MRPSIEKIPADEDLCSGAELESYLRERNEPPLSVLAVGDIMLGERTRKIIREEGADLPFADVVPLLRRSVVLGNQEGPFAGEAVKADRNFSYRVNPMLAALASAGVAVVGAAENERAAHRPVIRQAGRWRVGRLGYY